MQDLFAHVTGMLFWFKTLLSALVIASASELARRNTMLGGLIASLPLVSVITLCWLYRDTHDTERVIALCYDILRMVLPSLSLFIILPFLLGKHLPFSVAMGLACLLTSLVYLLALTLYRYLGSP